MTKYYTTSQVAKICNVHRNTIIGAIRRGILRIHRTPGGHARIAQEDLDEFCHARRLPADVVIPRGNRVLLIGADSLFVENATSRLSQTGFQVRSAANAFDVGFEVATFRPDVVLLNLAVPELRADLICRRIREQPPTREAVILGMGASSDPLELERWRDCGVDEFVSGPLAVEALVETVAELIGPPQDGNNDGTERPTMRLMARHSATLTRKRPPLRG